MRRRKILYAACGIGLVLLLGISLMLPKLIFLIQDSYRMETIVVEGRSGFDPTKLKVSYDVSMDARMRHFAQGLAEGKSYYASPTEYSIGVEQYLQLTDIMEQEFMRFFMDNQILPLSGQASYDIAAWKQYVIFNEEMPEDVAFVAWYIELTIEGNGKMEMLVDAQSDTIYYIQLTMPEGNRENTIMSYDNGSADSYYGYDIWYYGWETLYFFLSYYYETDFIEKLFGMEAETDISPNSVMTDDSTSLKWSLQYAGYALEMVTLVEDGLNTDEVTYSIGVTELGELIPELQSQEDNAEE